MTSRFTSGRHTSHAAAIGLALAAGSAFGVNLEAVFSPPPHPLASVVSSHADFRGLYTPPDVRHVADWAVDARDHENLPFLIIDKQRATLYVFARSGTLTGTTPILLGRATGDDFAPGVIDMDIYETSAWQRVTPAGRFRAEHYEKARGKWLLWIDYDSAIVLQKVPIDNGTKRARRVLRRRIRCSAGSPMVASTWLRSFTIQSYTPRSDPRTGSSTSCPRRVRLKR